MGFYGDRLNGARIHGDFMGVYGNRLNGAEFTVISWGFTKSWFMGFQMRVHRIASPFSPNTVGKLTILVYYYNASLKGKSLSHICIGRGYLLHRYIRR